MPELLHGLYDEEEQMGVLVFTDVHGLNYDVADPDLRRMSSQNQIERVISSLATFHSICTAFEQSQECTFEKMFPFLQGTVEKSFKDIVLKVHEEKKSSSTKF